MSTAPDTSPTLANIQLACDEARPDLLWRIVHFEGIPEVRGTTHYPCPYMSITSQGNGEISVVHRTGVRCWVLLPSLDHLKDYVTSCHHRYMADTANVGLSIPIHTGMLPEPADGSRNPLKPCILISMERTHVYTLADGEMHQAHPMGHNDVLRTFLMYLHRRGLR